MFKTINSKQAHAQGERFGHSCFEFVSDFGFRYSSLFRISDFDIRISIAASRGDGGV
jgi:hypothetical protein